MTGNLNLKYFLGDQGVGSVSYWYLKTTLVDCSLLYYQVLRGNLMIYSLRHTRGARALFSVGVSFLGPQAVARPIGMTADGGSCTTRLRDVECSI